MSAAWYGNLARKLHQGARRRPADFFYKVGAPQSSRLGNLVVAKMCVAASLQDVVSRSSSGLLTAIAFFGTPLAGVIIDEVENRVGRCFSGKNDIRN